MAIQATEKDGITYLSIDDEMTIYTALELKNALVQYLKADHELQINLASVSEIDSAGLQILLLLKQESEQKHIKLSLTEHSQAVTEVFELLNLSAHFGDPMVLSAGWS